MKELGAILLVLSTTACASLPEAQEPALAAWSDSAVATTPAGDTCVRLRRRHDDGSVADTRIAEAWPTRNYGDESAAFAGNVGGSERHALLAFSLDALPAGATITRATLTLHKHVCGGDSGLSAHRIEARWAEDSVTWQSFDGAFAAEPLTITADASTPERVSFAVTELVQGWAGDAASNHGVLIRRTQANTSFVTSEHDDVHRRPHLEVCYHAGS